MILVGVAPHKAYLACFMSLKPDKYRPTADFAIMMLYVLHVFQGLMCQLPSKCFAVKSSGNSP